MPTRKHFLAAAASMPLMAAAPAPPSPQPSGAAPVPKPSPSKKKISPLARDFAARMRDFDPALTEKELETIASGIDDNLKIGKQVNAKGRVLKNWDEPVTTFEVPE